MASMATRRSRVPSWRTRAVGMGGVAGAAAVWLVLQSLAPGQTRVDTTERDAAIRRLDADTGAAVGALRRGNLDIFDTVCVQLLRDAGALDRALDRPTPAYPDSPKPTRRAFALAGASYSRAGCTSGRVDELEHAQWLLKEAQQLRGP